MPKISDKEYRNNIKALMSAETNKNKVKNFEHALFILDFLIEYNIKRTYFSELLMITQSGFQKKMNGNSRFTPFEIDIIYLEISHLKSCLDSVKGIANAKKEYLDKRRMELIESNVVDVSSKVADWLISIKRMDLVPDKYLNNG